MSILPGFRLSSFPSSFSSSKVWLTDDEDSKNHPHPTSREGVRCAHAHTLTLLEDDVSKRRENYPQIMHLNFPKSKERKGSEWICKHISRYRYSSVHLQVPIPTYHYHTQTHLSRTFRKVECHMKKFLKSPDAHTEIVISSCHICQGKKGRCVVDFGSDWNNYWIPQEPRGTEESC